MNQQELIKCLHTYTETKHHPRANYFQSKTYHANSSATREHTPELQIYRQLKVTLKPLTSHNSLLDTSLHSREKKSSPTHQNTDTSFPNQETLTTTCTTPPTARKFHNKENSTNSQNTERPPQTQQYKQDEETEEYPAGQGTG